MPLWLVAQPPPARAGHSGPVCRRSPRPSTSRRSVWWAGLRMRPISAALLMLSPPSKPQPGNYRHGARGILYRVWAAQKSTTASGGRGILQCRAPDLLGVRQAPVPCCHCIVPHHHPLDRDHRRSKSGVASPGSRSRPRRLRRPAAPVSKVPFAGHTAPQARRRSVAAPGWVSRWRPRPMGGWLRGCGFLTARGRLPARCVDPVA